MSDFLLETRRLSKSFRLRGIRAGQFPAVREVSLSVRRNSIFGLVGESGCGKTTLARSIVYLDRPTAGSVVFDGTDLRTLSAGELRLLRKKMQIIFQDPESALNPKLKVRTSLVEGLANFGVGRSERNTKAAALADLVGIPSSHLDRRPHEFSGGQKQRLVIARALTLEPAFLILDEPVSNLDVSVQAQIINLLLDLKNELSLTYMFISHDLNLISYLSDSIGVMYAGRIVETAPAEAILDSPLHVYTRKLFSSVTRVVGKPHLLRGSGADDSVAAEAPVSAGRNRATADRKAARPRSESATGCAFSATCKMKSSLCLETIPELREVKPGHFVACHNAGQGMK